MCPASTQIFTKRRIIGVRNLISKRLSPHFVRKSTYLRLERILLNISVMLDLIAINCHPSPEVYILNSIVQKRYCSSARSSNAIFLSLQLSINTLSLDFMLPSSLATRFWTNGHFTQTLYVSIVHESAPDPFPKFQPQKRQAWSCLASVESNKMEGYSIEHVDPKKIVNVFFSRPVLPADKAIVKEGFLSNGYQHTYLISCRPASAPEVESFLRQEHEYSPEKAAAVTKTVMAKGESGGYRFCYDGHIRKYVSIDLIDEGILAPNFKLKSSLHHDMSPEEAIAFSLSKNSVQSFCVPLTFLVTFLRCHEYDYEVNASRTVKRQKPLSATEVGRRMVSCNGKNIVEDKLLSKQAETKRQILGVCRRLPPGTVDFLRDFLVEDIDGLHVSFTLANLRAIPRNVSDEECLCLVKRIVRYYETCLPSPKPIHPKNLPEQLVNVRRAEQELANSSVSASMTHSRKSLLRLRNAW